MSVQEQKALLRKVLRARLQDVNSLPQQKLQAQVIDLLSGQSGIWGAFWPQPGEPDLRPVWKQASHLTWVFPRVHGEELHFHIWQGDEKDGVVGVFGILEPPVSAAKVELNQIHGLLIPGLGFDRQGRRLGKGKGFYDRLLEGWNGTRVCAGFEAQWVDEVPVDRFDQRVDQIVTEAGLWVPPGRQC